ncbi:MAG: TetR/AcrR family transcriptional regulator [Myxococcota bacterium]
MSSVDFEARETVRFPGVRPPKPLLSPETERRLTARQKELLDQLEALVTRKGVAERTMAEIASEVNCSLRTLYGISPSKEELVLTIVDRRLRRIGRAAILSLDASLAPLDALRAYLGGANQAVQSEAIAFSEELASLPGAKRLLDAHEGYVIAVTQSLLDRAVAGGEIAAVDTASVAHVLGGLGREFARPEVAEVAAESPKATADAITGIILRGLEQQR